VLTKFSTAEDLLVSYQQYKYSNSPTSLTRQVQLLLLIAILHPMNSVSRGGRIVRITWIL